MCVCVSICVCVLMCMCKCEHCRFSSDTLFVLCHTVQEMVHCAVEYGSPCEADHVTFGEFCVLVDELRHKYKTCDVAPVPRAHLVSKNHGRGNQGRRKRRGQWYFDHVFWPCTGVQVVQHLLEVQFQAL